MISALKMPSFILATSSALFLACFWASSSMIISGRFGSGALVLLGPGYRKLIGLGLRLCRQTEVEAGLVPDLDGGDEDGVLGALLLEVDGRHHLV